jgi:D-alanyl-D-alanine carboxypeptidase
MSVKDLLYGLMVYSANDAAVILAEKTGGSMEGFAALMNTKAKELGMNESHFVTPNGLPAAGHYSTAADMAKLAVYAEKNPTFAEIVNTKKITITGAKPYPIENRNKLLWRYPYTVGIKTGYTKEAGYCLVSAARKGSEFLIAVVLGCPATDDSFNSSKTLLQWGFDNYDYQGVASANKAFRKLDIPYYFGRLPLNVKQDFGVLTSKDEKISYKINLRKADKLPIKVGDKFGSIKVFSNNNLIGQADLFAMKKYEEKTFLQKTGFLVSSIWLRFKELFKYFAYAG